MACISTASTSSDDPRTPGLSTYLTKTPLQLRAVSLLPGSPKHVSRDRPSYPTVGFIGASAITFFAERSASSSSEIPKIPCRISLLCSPKSGE